MDAANPSVFLSYQWGRQPQVQALYRTLTQRGYHCWMDIYQMGGGDSLYDKIDRGIRGCKVVVSCVTPKYSLSANCRREVSLADALKKPIVPLLLETMTWPPEGPMSMVFTQLLYISFIENLKSHRVWDGPSFEELLGKLQMYSPVGEIPAEPGVPSAEQPEEEKKPEAVLETQTSQDDKSGRPASGVSQESVKVSQPSSATSQASVKVSRPPSTTSQASVKVSRPPSATSQASVKVSRPPSTTSQASVKVSRPPSATSQASIKASRPPSATSHTSVKVSRPPSATSNRSIKASQLQNTQRNEPQATASTPRTEKKSKTCILLWHIIVLFSSVDAKCKNLKLLVWAGALYIFIVSWNIHKRLLVLENLFTGTNLKYIPSWLCYTMYMFFVVAFFAFSYMHWLYTTDIVVQLYSVFKFWMYSYFAFFSTLSVSDMWYCLELCLHL